MLLPHISDEIGNQTAQMMREHPQCLEKSPREIFALVFLDFNLQPEDEEDAWCLNHIRENEAHATQVIAAAMGMM